MKRMIVVCLTLSFVFALSACANTAGVRAYETPSNAQHQSEESVAADQTPAEETTSKTNEFVKTTSAVETVKPEAKEVKPVPQKSKEDTPPAAAPPSAEVSLISREEAIEIALTKAGLARDSVYELEAELDKERNGIFWEIDFETRELEYSYEINAETGTIVYCEKEKND